MKEKTFESKVKKYLDSIGAWYIKYWAGAAYTKSGVPDLLCCINGKFVALELKNETGKASELQLYTIEKIKESGGYAMVLRPQEFEAFKNFCEAKFL